MNFADFQQLRAQMQHERKDVLDCAETNLYRALTRHIPPATHTAEHTVHRCDLAARWAKLFDFPPETARRALVSCGVRHSLAVLFQYYAAKGARLWLPEDNYPVYGELASAAGLAPRTFPTLPAPRWPAADCDTETAPELLVVTNPLKPLGRWLDSADVSALTAWLAASSRRRLLLDAVYTFETRFHGSTLNLLRTGQTLLLHSLTKGWLSPRLFGVTLVPITDVLALTPLFRHQPPPQANLIRAHELLASHFDLPATVARELDSAQNRLCAALPLELPRPTASATPRYLFPIAARWSDLVAEFGVLGLPASVFGSARKNITILGSLNFTL
ncbi:MAG: aminotransferase class I/II-fold pyridoxal phosphate-dependent enzyme [Planctomycetota bacterium]